MKTIIKKIGVSACVALVAVLTASHLVVAETGSAKVDTKAVIAVPTLTSVVKDDDVPADFNGLSFRSSAFHKKAVDLFAASLATEIAGKTDDAEYCEAVDRAFMRQAPLVRASFAWDADSYKDSFPAIDKAVAEKQYGEDGVDGYVAVGTEVANLTAKDGALLTIQASRAKAIMRSSMLGLLLDGKANETTVANLKALYSAGERCVAFFSNDAKTADVLAKTHKIVLEEAVAATVDESVTVSRGDLNGEVLVVPKVTSVTTRTALREYSLAVIAHNPEIRSISATKDAVTIKFVERGRFLGFIPTWITRKVTVTVNDIKFAGAALSKKSGMYNQADLKTAIDAVVKVGDTSFSNTTQAMIVGTVVGYIETPVTK